MKRKALQCLLCVNLVQSETDLKAHILSHHMHSVFLCDLCHRLFYEEVEANEHVSSHLVSKDALTCFVKQEPVDSAEIASSFYELQHENFKSSLFTYACDLCNQAFLSFTDLKAHILKHGVGIEETKTEVIANEHSLTALNDYMISADRDLGATSTPPISATSTSPISAKRSKQPTKKIKQKKFVSKSSVKFKCDICSKPFLREAWLTRHKAAVHGHETAKDAAETDQQTVDLLDQSISHAVLSVEPSQDNDPGDSTVELDIVDSDVTNADNNVTGLSDNCVETKTEASVSKPGPLTRHTKGSTSEKSEPGRANPPPNPDNTDLQCRICNRHLATKLRLQVHMAMHRNDASLKCHECDKQFKNKQQLFYHMEKHVELECNVCSAKCNDLSVLDDHMGTHIDGPKQFQCDRCDKSFYFAKLLTRHKKNHEMQFSVACSVCDKLCVNKKALLRHMRHHTGDTYDCRECGKKFFHKDSFKSHVRCHTGELPFVCEICAKTYRLENSLKLHMQRQHQNLPRTHKCTLCPKTFYKKWDLKSHMAVHSDDRPFTCEECGKSFKTEYALQAHFNIHNGVKEFKCDICDYRSWNQSLLRRHKERHSSSKDFRCPECESSFVCRRYLNAHIRAIHRLGHLKPHVCDQCGKGFRTRDHLKRHEVSHSREQPYSCDVCGRSYKHKCHMEIHRQTCIT